MLSSLQSLHLLFLLVELLLFSPILCLNLFQSYFIAPSRHSLSGSVAITTSPRDIVTGLLTATVRPCCLRLASDITPLNNVTAQRHPRFGRRRPELALTSSSSIRP
ncbi:hypothetical protein BJX61DRAFT_368686 [Aspergillus egyptiacus]|nr:hypothetical protein BJX61DRAFT_368686 [Aspergillus egyptiacus]